MRFSPLFGGLLLAGVLGCQVGDNGDSAPNKAKLQEDIKGQNSEGVTDKESGTTDAIPPQFSSDETVNHSDSQDPQTPATAKDDAVNGPPPERETKSPTMVQPNACVGVDKSSGGIGTIEQAIELINQLPMPVTVACFLEALQRPLRLFPTKSRISAQPAFDEYSPRIFIFSGPLTISVVPAGEGSKVIEFGYQTTETTSIKGELPFPVTERLTADAAYRHILAESGDHTLCGPCHRGETVSSAVSGIAFESQAFRPHPREHLSFEFLEQEGVRCKGKSDTRCNIFNAIFSHGDVIYQEFPAGMPTIF